MFPLLLMVLRMIDNHWWCRKGTSIMFWMKVILNQQLVISFRVLRGPCPLVYISRHTVGATVLFSFFFFTNLVPRFMIIYLQIVHSMYYFSSFYLYIHMYLYIYVSLFLVGVSSEEFNPRKKTYDRFILEYSFFT